MNSFNSSGQLDALSLDRSLFALAGTAYCRLLYQPDNAVVTACGTLKELLHQRTNQGPVELASKSLHVRQRTTSG